MNKICLIIVNYFSHNKIQQLLESIPREEIIYGKIVDNSANDHEFHRLISITKHRPEIECIKSEQNGGFSYGTNLGLQFALKNFDAFLILNPDIVVDNEFFRLLTQLNSAMPDVAISPQGKYLGTKKLWSAGGKFHWIRGRGDVETKDRRSGETDFGTCACLLVPKSAIEEIGFLDEDFFLGGEEWDYSLRLRKAKWHILYAKHVIYFHEVSGTHEKYGLKFFFMGMRTKVLFARKHYGIFFWVWLILVMVPSIPFLLYRNSKINRVSLSRLITPLLKAISRSTMKKKITEAEFTSIEKKL